MSPAYLLRAVRQRGLRFFWVYFRESIWFDVRRRTRTSTRVTTDRQEISDGAADDGLLYVASFTSVIRETTSIARATMDEPDDCRFVDLGCGKAKTLIVYGEDHPESAHSPVGIEYDAALVEVARSNLAQVDSAAVVRHDSAVNVLDHVGDEPLIVYLYNSFQGQTLRDVLEQLASRRHVVVYVDPVEIELFETLGYTAAARSQGRWNADTWAVLVPSTHAQR